MQVSSLHLHTNLEGIGDLHGNHIHVEGPDVHGNETEIDDSFLDFFSAWVKPISFLILFIAVYLSVVTFAGRVWTAITKTFCPRCYSRWRPPLRAPPLTIFLIPSS
jgi:hypothetical protein